MQPSKVQPYQYPKGEVARHSVSVAAVIRDDAGRVLLTQRADNYNWEIPGGIVETDEDLMEALAREVMEETGLTVETRRLTGVYKNLRYGVVALVFLCHPLHGEPTVTRESNAVEYVDPAALPERVGERMLPRILDAISDAPGVSVRSSDSP